MVRWQKLRNLWAPFSDSQTPLYAAGAGFYILLSLLPGAVLLISVLAAFPISQKIWSLWFRELLPAPFWPMIESLLRLVQDRSSAAVVSVSALATVWSGSKGMIAITDGLNAVLEEPQQTGYFRKRFHGIRSLLFTALLLAMILVLHSVLPGRFTLLPISLLIAMLYRKLPSVRLPFRFCMIGGATAGLGLIVLSQLFSLYVRFFDRYHLLYGSIGLVALACMWLHLSIIMLLYGAILADLLEKDGYHPLQILKDVIS